MQNITPFLWFGKDAEKAAKFYTSVFPGSKILGMSRYGEESANIAGMPAGSVLTVAFRLLGQDFTALNGGPFFKFNESVSFFVYCRTRRSLDGLYRKLSRNGKILQPLGKYPFAERYAFFKDRFGVAWQLILSPGRPHIAPCLLFVGKSLGKGEAAVRFYTSVFKKAKIRSISRYGKGEPGRTGTLKHCSFSLEGLDFVAMEGTGAYKFSFNESVSFAVSCRTQAEIDYYWKKLTYGGEESQCGWLKDRYGVSWQVVPASLDSMLSGPKGKKVMGALLKMKKLDIKKLKQAMK